MNIFAICLFGRSNKIHPTSLPAFFARLLDFFARLLDFFTRCCRWRATGADKVELRLCERTFTLSFGSPDAPWAFTALNADGVAMADGRLSDAMQREEDGRAEIKRAELALKAAQTHSKQGQKEILACLDELMSSAVTVRALEKTLVGVTVNKLRKHEVPQRDASRAGVRSRGAGS